MGLQILIQCDECFAKPESDLPTFKRYFDSSNGKGYGFGVHKWPHIQDLMPQGWLAADPYTSCTYCPKCWAIKGEG